jgi:hypothetical protein
VGGPQHPEREHGQFTGVVGADRRERLRGLQQNVGAGGIVGARRRAGVDGDCQQIGAGRDQVRGQPLMQPSAFGVADAGVDRFPDQVVAEGECAIADVDESRCYGRAECLGVNATGKRRQVRERHRSPRLPAEPMRRLMGRGRGAGCGPSRRIPPQALPYRATPR